MMKEKKEPVVSIIILNYNTFEMTCDCIQSIYDKTKNTSFEIILVDNASKNCNPDNFKQRFPEICLIKSEINLGFSKGNNLGISKAKGQAILLLNSDTVLVNDAISICYRKLEANKDIGFITCKLIFPNGEIQHQCRRFETISRTLIELLRIHKFWSKEKRAKMLLGGYFNHETEIVSDRIWGTFFMFRKELLNEFPENKLSEQFFMYGEDNEWCYQLGKYTDKYIVYYPKAEVIHLMGGSRFKSAESMEKMKIINRNKKKYMFEYYGPLKTKILFFLQGIKQ